jgi:hypothetical protein
LAAGTGGRRIDTVSSGPGDPTASTTPAPSALWRPDELDLVARARELEIAVRRPDGTLRAWTPIWVVRVGEQVYVRSWHRRGTGWFGHAVADGRARVRVPGLSADVTVVDVGGGPDDGRARTGVDDAYRAKYGEQGAASMVTTAAAATTLRLDPAR